MTGPRPRLSDVLGRPARPSLSAALAGGPMLHVKQVEPAASPDMRLPVEFAMRPTLPDAGQRTVAPTAPPLFRDAEPPRAGDVGARDATGIRVREPTGLPPLERLTPEPEPVPAFGKGGTFGPGGPVNTAAGAGLRVYQFVPSYTVPASVALAVGEALQGEYLAAGLDATLGAALPWALRARRVAKADRLRKALDAIPIEARPVETPIARVTLPEVLPEEMTPAQADLSRAVAAGQRVDMIRARFGATVDVEPEVASINARIAEALAPEAVPPKPARVPRRTSVSALEVPKVVAADLPRNLANAKAPDLLAYLDHLDAQIERHATAFAGPARETGQPQGVIRQAQKFANLQLGTLQPKLTEVEDALRARGIDVEGHRLARLERAAIQEEAGEMVSDKAFAGAPSRAERIRARQLPSDVPFSPRVGNERGMVGPLYHGSPHKFDRFDVSKIGTGEGNQSYGHGLYFAEREGVARSYRNAGRSDLRQLVVPDEARTIFAELYPSGTADIGPLFGLDVESLATFVQSPTTLGKQIRAAVPERLLMHLDRATPSGAFYTTELPAVEVEHFLDWDKLVGDQPGPVRDALLKAFRDIDKEDVLQLGDMTGGDAYRYLASRVGGPKDASALLRDAGVRGNRYLDQGSRATADAYEAVERLIAKAEQSGHAERATELRAKLATMQRPSRNYVVFDDSDIRILNREGHGALKYLTGMTGAGLGGTAGAATIEPDDSPAERAAKIAAGTVIGAVAGVKGGQALERLGTRGVAPPVVEPVPARRPSPVTPIEDPLRQGPLRRPEANTIKRLDLPDDLSERVASMARQYEGPGYESHAQVQREAERLLATRNAPVDFTRGDRREVLAAAAMLRQNTEEAGKLAQRLADPTLTATARAELDGQLRYLDTQSRTLLGSITRAKTEQARDLAANRIFANLTATPEHWQYKAQQVAQRPLTDLEAAEIRRLLGQGKRDEMLRFVGGLRPTTLGERIVTFWKSGLLTNPATHAANISSNALFQLTEETARTPAAFWDWAISKTTDGLRTKTPTNAAIVRASARGALNGIREIPKRVRGIPTGNELALGEIPLVTDMGHPLLTSAVSIPFRMLDAADRPFFQSALQGSLAEQATILGQAEGLAGKALKARVAELLARPTDDMAARALHDAAVRTFRDETALGGFLGDVGRRFGPAGSFVVPFSKTPGAVATRFAEYTPFGFARGAQLWRQAVKESVQGLEGAAATQQKAAEVLGRSTVGLGPIILGAIMYRSGRASGQTDLGDQSGRATRRMLNVPDDAFQIGGAWVEPNRLGPVGMLMSLGAVMAQQAEAEGSPLTRAGQAAFAGARTVTDQPFLQGIENLQRARESTEGAGQYLAKLGASVVPAGVAALARATDPVEREAKTFGEQVQARIPWWSQQLPPRRTPLGDERQRLGPGAQAALSPVRVTPIPDALDDQLLAEVARTGAQLSQPKRLDGETGEAYSARVAEAGKVIRRRLLMLVGSDRYQRMPPAGLVRQRPQWAGLTGDALQRAYQAELIEDLTRQTRGSETRRARHLEQQQ